MYDNVITACFVENPPTYILMLQTIDSIYSIIFLTLMTYIFDTDCSIKINSYFTWVMFLFVTTTIIIISDNFNNKYYKVWLSFLRGALYLIRWPLCPVGFINIFVNEYCNDCILMRILIIIYSVFLACFTIILIILLCLKRHNIV